MKGRKHPQTNSKVAKKIRDVQERAFSKARKKPVAHESVARKQLIKQTASAVHKDFMRQYRLSMEFFNEQNMFEELYKHFKAEYPESFDKGIRADKALIGKYFRGWDKYVKPERMSAVISKYIGKASDLGGQEALGHLGISAQFHMRDEATLARLGERGGKIARQIGDTTQKGLQNTLQRAYVKNGMNPRQVKKLIENKFRKTYKNRALTIARTETGIAQAQASHQTYEENLVTHKQWRAMMVNSRKSHTHANGQKKKINEPFSVGGSLMMHPLDPGADPAEIVNCRCVERPIVTTQTAYNDDTGLKPNGVDPWTGGGGIGVPPRTPRMDRQFKDTYGRNGSRGKRIKKKSDIYADPKGTGMAELAKMPKADNTLFQKYIDARQYERAYDLLHRYSGYKSGFLNSTQKSALKRARKAYARCKGFKG